MKKGIMLLIVFMLLCSFVVYGAEKAPKKVIALASELAKYGKDGTIISAVKSQNAKGQKLDQIKALDEKWKSTPGVVDYMKALMTSACGKYLKKIQNSKSYFAEIFVMDKKGANVAMTDKTSDYWQGDEAKFTKSYNGGKGGTHISDVEFDDSSQAYIVQISVPVIDGKTVIGAITFGIDVDQID